MSIKSYDSIPDNVAMSIDLPFTEGSGIETHDVAKPHHPVELINTPTWGTSPGGIGVLSFDESNSEYAKIPAANSADLDFTSGDYSFGLWFNYSMTGISSQILAGKYFVNVRGWEIYTTNVDALRYISLRHHHAGGILTRSSAYSLGWEFSAWWFLGISRSGATCQMYRNGEPVETISELEDPETAAASDIVIGTRYTKDTNFFNGSMYGLRMWPGLIVGSEWENMFNRERDFFDV